MDKKLGVAIHGAGGVADAHAASWLRNPHVQIVSVSSRRRESAQRWWTSTVWIAGSRQL